MEEERGGYDVGLVQPLPLGPWAPGTCPRAHALRGPCSGLMELRIHKATRVCPARACTSLLPRPRPEFPGQVAGAASGAGESLAWVILLRVNRTSRVGKGLPMLEGREVCVDGAWLVCQGGPQSKAGSPRAARASRKL